MDIIFADRYTFDDPGIGAFAALAVFVAFLVTRFLMLGPARKRMLETVNAIAEKEQKEIKGHAAEHWLAILNAESRDPQSSSKKISINKTVVLNYGGHEYFFTDGDYCCVMIGDRSYSIENSCNAFFLVAVGEPAVQFLAGQESLFRHISGSEKLAVFSIFRHSDFTDALRGKKRLKNQLRDFLRK